MTNDVVLALILTLFAGLAAGIGGLLVLFTKITNKKFLSFSLGLSAGVMIFVSLADIFPEAMLKNTRFKGNPISQASFILVELNSREPYKSLLFASSILVELATPVTRKIFKQKAFEYDKSLLLKLIKNLKLIKLYFFFLFAFLKVYLVHNILQSTKEWLLKQECSFKIYFLPELFIE